MSCQRRGWAESEAEKSGIRRENLLFFNMLKEN